MVTNAPTPPVPFEPQNPEAVINNLDNPLLSFHALAQHHDTTTAALSLWLMRPDIQQRLALIESVTRQRARRIALDALPDAVASLQMTVSIHAHYEGHILYNPNDRAQAETRRRHRETARKAASVLTKIALIKEPLPEGGVGVGLLRARSGVPTRSAAAPHSPPNHPNSPKQNPCPYVSGPTSHDDPCWVASRSAGALRSPPDHPTPSERNSSPSAPETPASQPKSHVLPSHHPISSQTSFPIFTLGLEVSPTSAHSGDLPIFPTPKSRRDSG